MASNIGNPVNDVQKIELEDGNWWEVYKTPSRGMRKRLRVAGQKSYSVPPGTDVDVSDEESFKRFIMTHPECIHVDLLDDELLVCGTARWSYDMEISVESIDTLPDAMVTKVLEILRNNFADVPEENLEVGGETQ